MPESLFLDTCALIWLAEGSRRLCPTVRSRIDKASSVLVSAISAWEISLKVAKGELELPDQPENWFPAVLATHDLELSVLSPDVLMAANRLPWHHRDPADRCIIADACQRKVPVITADRRFAGYPVDVVF
jgi:PIN domain nuclease of toxin-antitoxin system